MKAPLSVSLESDRGKYAQVRTAGVVEETCLYHEVAFPENTSKGYPKRLAPFALQGDDSVVHRPVSPSHRGCPSNTRIFTEELLRLSDARKNLETVQ